MRDTCPNCLVPFSLMVADHPIESCIRELQAEVKSLTTSLEHYRKSDTERLHETIALRKQIDRAVGVLRERFAIKQDGGA